jgi:hypothetical protein
MHRCRGSLLLHPHTFSARDPHPPSLGMSVQDLEWPFRLAAPNYQKEWLSRQGGRCSLSSEWMAKHRRLTQHTMPRGRPRTHYGPFSQITLGPEAPAQRLGRAFLPNLEDMPHQLQATLQNRPVDRAHRVAHLQTQLRRGHPL